MMVNEDAGALRGGVGFVGLAPFLRLNVGGGDLLPVVEALLEQTKVTKDDATLWMNLATALLCMGQKEIGLTVQRQALAQQRVYHLPALQQPARLRLLLLCVPGELSANVPLDCLLENDDVDLVYVYLTPGAQWPDTLPANWPAHDALLVAISEADANLPLLQALEPVLADWPRPVLDAPHCIPRVGREAAYALLHDAPGIVMPPTWRIARERLARAADGADAWTLPLIVRPVGSHAGRDLCKIDAFDAMGPYLAGVADAEFFVSPFVDYRNDDGCFRKMRVALIDGVPFACHMAVSEHWMIHYVNAGMYAEPWKRQQEAAFMDTFADFAERHGAAWQAIHQRCGLDYVCLDCAETRDGRLLIFEIDHAMVVHAMDPEDMFPYKQAHMQRVSQAFRAMLQRRVEAAA